MYEQSRCDGRPVVLLEYGKFFICLLLSFCLFCFSRDKSYRSGLGRQRRRTVFKNV